MNTDRILDEVLAQTASEHGRTREARFDDLTPLPCYGYPAVEVTGETVQDAALRFRGKCVTILNFASGVMPGGGVRFGAMAQEEALCLSSGLLHELEAHLEYYEANHTKGVPPECHDRLLWSEEVPLVRDGNFQPVDPMLVQVITYPAPIARDVADEEAVFRRRCPHVVHQAATHGTEVLVLGAWGCGEYGNDPGMVAMAFKDALFKHGGHIERVVFAVAFNEVNRLVFQEVFKTW